MATNSTSSWADYSAKNLQRCLSQARTLKKQLTKLGGERQHSLQFDFMFFDDARDNVEQLANLLSERYLMNVEKVEDGNYWRGSGTITDISINKILESYSLKWVEEMCDLSQSHGCTFSSWGLIDWDSRRYWRNSGIGELPAVG